MTTGFSVVADFNASSTCHTIGLPHRGCNTFGRSDFIRVPCPAARRTAVTFMENTSIAPSIVFQGQTKIGSAAGLCFRHKSYFTQYRPKSRDSAVENKPRISG